MAEFDRSCTISCQSATISIDLSCTIFKLFYAEEYRDLEIYVRCHSRSCVRLSVTFVYCVETKKHILKLFHRPIILEFPCQTLWKYFDGECPPNGGIECRWGRQNSRFSTNIWLDRWLLQCEQQLRPSTVLFTAQTATRQWIFKRLTLR